MRSIRKDISLGTHNAWAQLFEPTLAVPMHLWELDHLTDYNLFILYGVSCSPELAGAEVVKRQMEISFCDTSYSLRDPPNDEVSLHAP